MSTSPRTAGDKPVIQNKWLDLLLKIGLALLTPVLFLGVLEGVATLWEMNQSNGLYAWEMVASRRLDLVKYQEPGAGYTLMIPNSHYEWQGIPVDINSHGLRGLETPYSKPPDTYRILNLGDSVSWGWGVEYEGTYGKLLEDKLNAEPGEHPVYEVINAGIPGWNPENYHAYLQAEGLKYQPDLIILDLTLVNDIYGKSALAQNQRPPLIEWLRAHTHFWPFLSIQLQWISARLDGKDRIEVIDPPTDPASYFPLDPEAVRWTDLWAEVQAMHELAVNQGAQFVIVLLPLEFQVLDPGFPTLPQTILTEAAEGDQIPILDLLPVFTTACNNKPGGKCQLEDRYLFADVWMHPSVVGHELIANELLNLINRDILP